MKFSTFAIFTPISLMLLVTAKAVFAQPRPSITPAQAQRLSRDLVRSNSQDFFQQGQEQMEKEIQFLTRRQLFLQEGVLKISQDLQIQQDLSPFERPEILRPGK